MSLSLIIAAASAAISANPANPIEPADRGMVECFSPNEAEKTCEAIGSYFKAADGQLISKAVMLISPEPLVKMELAAPVFIRDGAICGKITLPDILKARFITATGPLDAARTAIVRARLKATMSAKLNIESCYRYTQGDNIIFAAATVNGREVPEHGRTMIWVDPSEGYKVAP
jgi:hypothetical protein